MKLLSRAALMLVLVWLPAAAFAEGADDQYLGIYYLIERADALNEGGQLPAALDKYTEAQSELKKFQFQHPEWNLIIINFRLAYLDNKIADIKAKIPPPTPVVPPTPPPVQPAPQPAPIPVVSIPPPPVNYFENIIKDLQQQLDRANADRSLLQAKLREALAVQPAALDPGVLAQAQEQNRSLEKENALLKTSLDESRTARAHVDADALAAGQARQQLAEVQRRAGELAQANTVLTSDKAKLEARVKELLTPDATTQALRAENEVLKKQVAELKLAPASSDQDMSRKLLAAQAEVAALQSDKDILRLEKIALEDRLKRATATVAVVDPAVAEKIRALESERDGLQRRLDTALSQIAADRSGKDASLRVDETSRQLADLRARIDILEARQIPYTPEELALISRPEATQLAAAVHVSGRKSPNELPAKATALLAEAKRDVANHQLDLAEEKYLEILKLDEKNPATLSDLASIQVDLNHTADAEKHITAALVLQPDNEYSLFVLGRLRFQQERYDDAFEALSHAARLNPENAEIQNYLGITLSEKGLRGPAEAALRKAIQIDPGFASAHANLAFVYITQQPPLAELARWHYEKALAAGQPHNPAIEKLIYPDRVAPVGTAENHP